MTRLAIAALGLALVAAPARAGHWHGGGWHGAPVHGCVPRTRVFIGGTFGWDPFFAPYFYYPYPSYYPYYMAYPAYPPAPPQETAPGAPPGDQESGGDSPTATPTPPDDARRVTYGLVQLRGVPDGAAIDLDGRFWLTATDLDKRRLALPEGEHQLTVRVDDAAPVARTIAVVAGKQQSVRLGPIPRRAS